MDVLASDLAVTALAERSPVDSDDAALLLLQAWAADIVAHPIAIEVEAPEPAMTRRRPRGAARSVVAMTVVLTLSSTGIAAAVRGNPFAPFNYVVDKFGQFAQHDRTPPSIPLGARRLLVAEPMPNDARERAQQDRRPSRTRPDRQSAPDAGPTATAPIVTHRVPRSSGGADQTQQPRERHRQLVVRRPHAGPVDGPKPHGGETPPNRPEPPAIPSVPTWPKPVAAAPPD